MPDTWNINIQTDKTIDYYVKKKKERRRFRKTFHANTNRRKAGLTQLAMLISFKKKNFIRINGSFQSEIKEQNINNI